MTHARCVLAVFTMLVACGANADHARPRDADAGQDESESSSRDASVAGGGAAGSATAVAGGAGGAVGARAPIDAGAAAGVDGADVSRRDAGAPPVVAPDAGASAVDLRPFVPAQGAFFGNSRCAASGLAFCEDFEGGLSDTSWKKAASSGNDVRIDQARFARGKSALHVSLTRPGRAFMTLHPLPTNLPQHFFGRVFLYSEGAPARAINGAAVQSEYFRVKTIAGDCLWNSPPCMHVWQAWYGDVWRDGSGQGGDLGGRSAGAPGEAGNHTPLAAGKWMCLEFEIDPEGSSAAWLDGEVLMKPHPQNKARGTFDWVELGLTAGEAATRPVDIWLDEFALDGARIGCTR